MALTTPVTSAITLEVDDAVQATVTTATVTDSDTTLVVTTGTHLEHFNQTLFRLELSDLSEIRNSRVTVPGL